MPSAPTTGRASSADGVLGPEGESELRHGYTTTATTTSSASTSPISTRIRMKDLPGCDLRPWLRPPHRRLPPPHPGFVRVRPVTRPARCAPPALASMALATAPPPAQWPAPERARRDVPHTALPGQ